jgi:hypothetical protein
MFTSVSYVIQLDDSSVTSVEEAELTADVENNIRATAVRDTQPNNGCE